MRLQLLLQLNLPKGIDKSAQTVYDINTNGADFSISFSDEMDFSDIENNIEIVDSDGNTYQIKDIITDDYTVSFSGDNLPLGETLTLNVKKEIKNKKGVPLTKDVVKAKDGKHR